MYTRNNNHRSCEIIEAVCTCSEYAGKMEHEIYFCWMLLNWFTIVAVCSRTCGVWLGRPWWTSWLRYSLPNYFMSSELVEFRFVGVLVLFRLCTCAVDSEKVVETQSDWKEQRYRKSRKLCQKSQLSLATSLHIFQSHCWHCCDGRAWGANLSIMYHL